MHVDSLRRSALLGVADLSAQPLLQLLRISPRPEYVERAVCLYLTSSSFAVADEYGTILIQPYAQHLSDSQVERILVAVGRDSNLQGFDTEELLRALYLAGRAEQTRLDAAIQAVGATSSSVRRA
jgi:hypothetical protein